MMHWITPNWITLATSEDKEWQSHRKCDSLFRQRKKRNWEFFITSLCFIKQSSFLSCRLASFTKIRTMFYLVTWIIYQEPEYVSCPLHENFNKFFSNFCHLLMSDLSQKKLVKFIVLYLVKFFWQIIGWLTFILKSMWD